MKACPRIFIPVLLLTVTSGVGSGLALAQDSSTYYTVMHPEEFEIDWGAFYRDAERRTAAVRKRLPHHLNQAYGEDAKQRLDLYLPEGEVEAAPVFLFLHGGGFREGDRAQYGFVAEPFAAHGIITAVASYRLTEDGHHYPAQPEDARAAVEWLYRHVAEYGGDREAIYVGGHSAGAILAADIGVDRAWLGERGIPESALRGIAPISGSYDLRGAGRDYTPSAEAEALASPILHIEAPVPEVVVAVGSTEEKYLASSRNFVERLEQADVTAELVVAEGQDHRETVKALGQERSSIFRTILEMMRPAE
jgi:acetyl esterase/lipase